MTFQLSRIVILRKPKKINQKNGKYYYTHVEQQQKQLDCSWGQGQELQQVGELYRTNTYLDNTRFNFNKDELTAKL